MIRENHGITCLQEMILEVFNRGLVFGQPFEENFRSGRTELHKTGDIYTCSQCYHMKQRYLVIVLVKVSVSFMYMCLSAKLRLMLHRRLLANTWFVLFTMF